MGAMMPAQVVLHQQEAESKGLRSRKKIKTRLAIEDAALDLFDNRGYEATTVEEIAELAEVSTTTFFRYFPSKAEVVLNDYGPYLPELHQAIVDRPRAEDDLLAFQHAVQEKWVAAIDPVRTARKARIVATSDMLRGMSYQRGHLWLEAVSDGLARRRRLKAPDDHSVVAARVALGVLASAVEGWIDDGCKGDLGAAVDRSFDVMTDLYSQWSRTKRGRGGARR